MQQGKLDATFIYPTPAKQAADAAEAIVNKKPVQKKLVLGTTAVSKGNAAQLYQQYDFSKKVG